MPAFLYNECMDKIVLRKYAKDIRAGLDIYALSARVVAKISSMSEFKKAKNVLLFHPKGSELNLLSLCDADKNFYLPRVEDGKLLVCPYSCEMSLKLSEFKVLEPCSAPVSPEIIDFAIIPCLMADRKHFRLGYGGGFYDRFLPSLRQDCVKVVVVPSALLVDELPVAEFDIPVDLVITE